MHPSSSIARARLLARIRRRYHVVADRVEIAGMGFDFLRVADPNAVLDAVAREEDRLDKIAGHRRPADQLHLPYWAEVWDSGAAVGAWLAEAVGPAGAGRGRRLEVLDLGCGMGMAGVVAARLGHRVIFADLEAPPLLFATYNAWGDRSRVATRRLDWGKDRIARRFDLVAGSDILYDRKQWLPLEAFLRGHVAPGGVVVLGEPGRQSGVEFVPWILARGWTLSETTLPVPTRPLPIRLLQIRPPAGA